MPRVSRQGLYEYSIEEVQGIATAAGTTAQHVNRVLSGSKTNSVVLAEAVGAFTGKPAALYLVQKGVAIDPIPQGCPSFPETYEITKEPDKESLALLSDVELLQFAHDVRMQWAEIAVEMHKRMNDA